MNAVHILAKNMVLTLPFCVKSTRRVFWTLPWQPNKRLCGSEDVTRASADKWANFQCWVNYTMLQVSAGLTFQNKTMGRRPKKTQKKPPEQRYQRKKKQRGETKTPCMTSIHYAGAESSPALLISPCLFSTQRVRLLRGPIQTHSAHFDETVLPMMSTRHENTHTHTPSQQPCGEQPETTKILPHNGFGARTVGNNPKIFFYIYIYIKK